MKTTTQKAFEALEKKSLAAINKAFDRTTLNEKPALLAFDNTETDIVSYTAVRNGQLIANYTVEVTLEELDAMAIAELQARKLSESLDSSIAKEVGALNDKFVR